jgi:hypothetical protein
MNSAFGAAAGGAGATVPAGATNPAGATAGGHGIGQRASEAVRTRNEVRIRPWPPHRSPTGRAVPEPQPRCPKRTVERTPDHKTIRILLAVQMRLLRGALAAVLSAEDDLEVTDALASTDELALIADVRRPDVMIIDLEQLVDADPATVYQLNETLPDCPVLVLTDMDNPGKIQTSQMPTRTVSSARAACRAGSSSTCGGWSPANA